MIADCRGADTMHEEEIVRPSIAKIWIVSVASALILVACGGAHSTVGGTVSGLGAGLSVTLQNNGADDITITSDQHFIIATAAANYNPYNVTVAVQPIGQTCVVANGSGVVGAIGASMENIAVTCTYPTSLGGVVSGLAPGGSVTLNNNGIPLVVTANGQFLFPENIPTGSTYAVTVGAQPAGQTCTVTSSNASGIVVADQHILVQIGCI